MDDEQKKNNNDYNNLSPEEQLRQINRDREAARNEVQEISVQQQLNTVRKPIFCPQCGSRELAFVSEYHRCLVLKIASYVIVFIIIAILAFNFKTIISGAESGPISFIILFAFFYIFLQIGILVRESKTHAKAICRDCGHIWLLD